MRMTEVVSQPTSTTKTCHPFCKCGHKKRQNSHTHCIYLLPTQHMLCFHFAVIAFNWSKYIPQEKYFL